jgi:hypothetical protein
MDVLEYHQPVVDWHLARSILSDTLSDEGSPLVSDETFSAQK